MCRLQVRLDLLHEMRNYPTYFYMAVALEPTRDYLTRPWWAGLSRYEGLILAAIATADERSRRAPVSYLSLSARKHALTEFIKSALLEAGIPIEALPVGGTSYLWIPSVALVRVKAMDARGRPVNFATPTAEAYLDGDLLPDYPPEPRVDIAYDLDPITSEVRSVAFKEWRGKALVAEYWLPWRGADRRAVEVIDLPLDVTGGVAVRARRGEKRKAAADDQQKKGA